MVIPIFSRSSNKKYLIKLRTQKHNKNEIIAFKCLIIMKIIGKKKNKLLTFLLLFFCASVHSRTHCNCFYSTWFLFSVYCLNNYYLYHFLSTIAQVHCFCFCCAVYAISDRIQLRFAFKWKKKKSNATSQKIRLFWFNSFWHIQLEFIIFFILRHG